MDKRDCNIFNIDMYVVQGKTKDGWEFAKANPFFGKSRSQFCGMDRSVEYYDIEHIFTNQKDAEYYMQFIDGYVKFNSHLNDKENPYTEYRVVKIGA